jgi:hypothetical protein
MRIPTKTLRWLCPLLVLFLAPVVPAQRPDNIAFGCGDVRTEIIEHPPLLFESIAAPDAIREWQSRPVLTFAGFNIAEYGFREVRFYRWHVLVPGRDPTWRDYSQRLDLAIEVIASGGSQWFHLIETQDYPLGLLYIQPGTGDAETGDVPKEPESNPESTTDARDEMGRWLTIKLASPNASLPIFLLDYSYNDSGANAGGTIRNEILLAFQKGSPRIAKAAQCILWEGGGVCGAPDTALAFRDKLNCSWDAAANDFRCALISAYGGTFSQLVAQHDFYLLSEKTAKPAPDVVPDLVVLAQQSHGNSKLPSSRQNVDGLGPTTLLAHYNNLLPASEVFVFANAAAGTKIASHFTVLTFRADDKPMVQSIAKWDISGEETDEVDPPADFTPTGVDHQYRIHMLETRPGFRAIEVTLTSGPVRVVYWIGLEAVQGTLVANTVRLASTGTSYGSCNQWLADGTASLIQRTPGLAEATVHVQSQESPMVADNEPQACSWAGMLHWKRAAGFRVRKLRDLCDSPTQIVTISEDGVVTSKDAPKNTFQ